MHNNKHQASSLSQNDYPNILFISGKAAEQPPQELNGLFLLPKCLYKSYYKALASCTTSVYVNLSKNSFFYAVARFLSESGCKGTNNFNTIQTFKRKNSQKHESFREY